MPLDPSLLPRLDAFCVEIAAGTMPPEACVDWLAEQDATLADVLLLYRGQPKEYTDGLPQAALQAWCRATEPGKAVLTPHEFRKVGRAIEWRWQAVGAVGIEQYTVGRQFGDAGLGFAPPLHYQGVEAIAADMARSIPGYSLWNDLVDIARFKWNAQPVLWPLGIGRGTEEDLGQLADAAVARARRWIKRCILSLFPEVEIVLRQRVSLAHCQNQAEIDRAIAKTQASLLESGWSPTHDVHAKYNQQSRELEYTQTIPAPQLIPEEREEYGPSPLRGGAFRSFAEMRLLEAARQRVQGIVDELAAENGLPPGIRVTIDRPGR